MKKLSGLASMSNLFKPKVGSNKWLETSSKEMIMSYRNQLCDILMNPNANDRLRVRIRDYILPHIDRVLYKK